MNRFLMATLGLMIASPAMSADLTPSFPSGGINPSRGIYGGMVTGLTITEPGAYAPSDLPVKLSIDGNQSGERASASVTAYTAVSARVASAGSGCPAGSIFSYGATGTKVIVSDGNGLSGATVSVVSGGTGNASAIPANPVSMTAAKSSCTPPKLNLSWGVQSVSLDNQGWGYASPPSGTGSVSMAPDAVIALVGTTVQTGVVSLPDKLVAASRVGAAGGVAGLDGSGALTNALNTSGDVSSSGEQSYGYEQAVPQWSFDGWSGDAPSHAAGPKVTVGVPQPNMADNLTMNGGHRMRDSVFMKTYALPYGVGDKGGCVNSVVMTGAPRTGANCGAGGWDAITQYELATNNAPWYVAGTDFKDENGVTHAAEFGVNSVLFRPALPDTYKSSMHYGMHILTNIVAGPTRYSGLSFDGVKSHMNQDQRFYGGMLSGWSSGSDMEGTYTKFTIANQWEPVSGGNVDAGHIPSVGSQSVSSDSTMIDALDQVQYSEFTHPFVVFGIYLKHFTRNTSCEVVAQSGSDGSAMKRLGPSRKCDEELDNWYYGPDYGATMHGLTIGYGGNIPSQDSYALSLSGIWPEGMRVWLANTGRDIDGDAFTIEPRIGPAATIGAKKEMAEFIQEPSANIGYLERFKLWQQVDGLNGTLNGRPVSNGTDTSYWMGPRQSSTKYNIDGWYESAVVFNPGWAKSGIALCGSKAAGTDTSASGGTGQYCLTVSTTGDASVSGNMEVIGDAVFDQAASFNANTNIKLGKSINFSDASGRLIGFLYGSTDGSIHSAGVFTANGLVVSSTSLNSLGAGTIDGQQRWCSNCKLNGITGVEAYWHSSASKWTDSQNNDLTTN